MKKLMTMIAAAAMAFGLYAEGEATPTFTNAVDWAGAQDENPFNISGDDLWTYSAGTIEAGEVQVKDEKLVLKTGAKVLARKFADSAVTANDDLGLFADITLDFQRQALDFESLPTAAELDGAKLALFILDTTEVEDAEVKGTNLYAIAGYGTTKALYQLSPVIDDTFWQNPHQFTIKFYNQALTDKARPGFLIFMDQGTADPGEGEPLMASLRYELSEETGTFDLTKATDCQGEEYLGTGVSVKNALKDWYNMRRLLLSMIEVAGQSFVAIDFKGNAQISNIEMTDDKDEFPFIPADIALKQITVDGNVAVTAADFEFDPRGGAEYADGVITVLDEATKITVTPKFAKDVHKVKLDAKVLKEVNGSYTFTYADGTVLEIDEADAVAYVKIDDEWKAYGDFEEAFAAASEADGSTLMLNANVEGALEVSVGGSMTLDLAGKTISAEGVEYNHGVIFVSGGALTITNSIPDAGGIVATGKGGIAVNNVADDGATVSIVGGKFTGLVQNFYEEEPEEGMTYGGIVATAGAFSEDPNGKFVAEDYEAIQGPDDYWYVQPAPTAVVEIVGGAQYTSFVDAFTNAEDGATIKFLADFTGEFFTGNLVTESKFVTGLTIDLNEKTWTLTGTAAQHERLWEDRKGNSFLIKNGSLTAVPDADQPQSIAFYTYAETFEFQDVTLDFSALAMGDSADPDDPRTDVAIVSQNGSVKFTGSTTVTLAENQRLVTILDRANAAYEPGTLTLDVDGELPGDILLYSACTIAVGEGTTLSGKVYTGAACNSGFEPAGALGSPFVALVGKIVPATGSTSINTRGGELFTTLDDANAAIEAATDKNIIVLNDVEVESFAVAMGTVNLEIAANVTFEATTLGLNFAQIKLNEGSALTAPGLTEDDFVAPAEGWKLKNDGDTWTIVAIKYATVEIKEVENCTIAVTNGDVAVESGATFDIDDAVTLDVYRVPAAGYKLADGCLDHEQITLGEEKTYTITAAVEEAPAEDDPTNIDPAKIPEGKTVGELFKKVPAELATADAKAFATWCQGNAIAGGSNVGEGGAAAKLDAFLLDCGNSAEEIAEAQKNFKVTGIAQNADGEWVITPATGAPYGNGEVTVKSYEDVGCTKEDEDGSFFKLTLGLPK